MSKTSAPTHLAIAFFFMTAFSIFALAWQVKSAMTSIDTVHQQLDVEAVGRQAADADEPAVIGQWPPREGTFYPDLVLTDQRGDISDIRTFFHTSTLVEALAYANV